VLFPSPGHKLDHQGKSPAQTFQYWRTKINGMRPFIIWATGLFLLAILMLTFFLAYLVLVPTTRASVQAELDRAGLHSQALVDFEANDSVHYGIHLLLGRTLALYPRTRRLADLQYSKARFHARTRHQLVLVTTGRPRTPAAAVSDAFRLGISGLEWLSGRVL
jgi:hypothetical protein